LPICAASEPTITALGHTYRKLRMFKEAAACFDTALSIVPGQASTFAGLAYTYHLEVRASSGFGQAIDDSAQEVNLDLANHKLCTIGA